MFQKKQTQKLWYDICCCLLHVLWEKEELKATLEEASKSIHYSHACGPPGNGRPRDRDRERERRKSMGCAG